MAKTIAAVFDSYDYAVKACQEIKNCGINGGDISILTKSEFEEEIKNSSQNLINNAGDISGDTGYLPLNAISVAGFGLSATGPISNVSNEKACGSLVDAIINLGINEESGYNYEKMIRGGNVLFTMPVSNQTMGKVAKILRECGGSELELHNK